MKKLSLENNAKRRFYNLMFIALILMIFAFLSSISSTDFAEIAFIDVGQGDAACIKAPSGESIIIDAGEDNSYEENMLPFLFSRGVTSIDYLFASHYHSDHVDGVYELMRIVPVKNLVIPETDDYGNNTKQRLLTTAQRNGVNVLEVSAGEEMEISDSLKVKFLFPDKKLFPNPEKNINNDSTVMLISCFNVDFLFTGDIEEEAETVLSQNYDIDADVLKVPHHGSSTSTSDKFLNAVSPEYAIISAGKNNSHGHPHKEVLSALKKADVKIYRTDKNGNIVFKLNKTGLSGIRTQYN